MGVTEAEGYVNKAQYSVYNIHDDPKRAERGGEGGEAKEAGEGDGREAKPRTSECSIRLKTLWLCIWTDTGSRHDTGVVRTPHGVIGCHSTPL